MAVCRGSVDHIRDDQLAAIVPVLGRNVVLIVGIRRGNGEIECRICSGQEGFPRVASDHRSLKDVAGGNAGGRIPGNRDVQQIPVAIRVGNRDRLIAELEFVRRRDIDRCRKRRPVDCCRKSLRVERFHPPVIGRITFQVDLSHFEGVLAFSRVVVDRIDFLPVRSVGADAESVIIQCIDCGGGIPPRERHSEMLLIGCLDVFGQGDARVEFHIARHGRVNGAEGDRFLVSCLVGHDQLPVGRAFVVLSDREVADVDSRCGDRIRSPVAKLTLIARVDRDPLRSSAGGFLAVLQGVEVVSGRSNSTVLIIRSAGNLQSDDEIQSAGPVCDIHAVGIIRDHLSQGGSFRCPDISLEDTALQRFRLVARIVACRDIVIDVLVDLRQSADHGAVFILRIVCQTDRLVGAFSLFLVIENVEGNSASVFGGCQRTFPIDRNRIRRRAGDVLIFAVDRDVRRIR